MSELHALLVGVDGHDPDHFPDGQRIPHLTGAVNDVRRMRELLVEGPPGLPEERVRMLTSPNPYSGRPRPASRDLPTLANLRRELEALGERAKPGDQVLVHFSGHGARVESRSTEPKWEGRWDECLVPCDTGVSGYLRDWEIHRRLHELAALGLRLVVILDCCHSGGSFRGSAVRGIAPKWLGPIESQSPGDRWITRSTRNAGASAGWWPTPPGAVLLAACRPTERALEANFRGVGLAGALTHHLLRATGALGPRATYRDLHRALLTRIHGRFPLQTPVLEGDADLCFLGREHWPGLRGVTVMAGRRRGGSAWVQLATGLAQGVAEGARFSLHRPVEASGGEGDAGSSVGDAEIVRAGGCTSWARAELTTEGEDARGWTAVLVDPGPRSLARRIAVHPVPEPDELPEDEREAARSVLEAIRTSIGRDRRSWLELAEEGGFDLGVAWREGLGLVVVDPGGEPLPVQGARIETSSELLDRLSHLARYAGVRALENSDHSSSLRDALELELRHLRSGRSGGAPELVSLRPEEGVPCGDEVELVIRNRSGFDLEVALLDIQPDWGVSQVHPASGGAVTVGPDEETVARLVVDLPFEGEEGRDLLKVIATREPVDFAWLLLPALDGSGATRRRSGAGARPSGSLEALFAGLTADRPPTRSGHPEVPSGDDWTVADVELRVVRSPTSAAAPHTPPG